MKSKIGCLLLLALMLVSFALPTFTVHAHKDLAPEVSAQFPSSVSGFEVLFKGSEALPSSAMPALRGFDMRAITEWLAIAAAAVGVILMLLGAKGFKHGALALFIASLVLSLAHAFHMQHLADALILDLMLETQFAIWVPVGAALVMALLAVLSTKGDEQLAVSTGAWRKLSGALCLLAALCLFLPFLRTSAPEGLTGDAVDAPYLDRTLNGMQLALGGEPMLSEIAEQNDVFQNVSSGTLSDLLPISDDATNILGAFQVKQNNSAPDLSLIGIAALLLIAGVLQFIPSIDRWFPTCLAALGAVLMAISMPGVVGVGREDFFLGATRQLCYLGFGWATLAPVLMTLLSVGGAATAVLGIRYADSPYFINPIPERKRIWMTALALALLATATIAVSSFTINYTLPGKAKTQASVEINGLQALMFQKPQEALNPVTTRGKAIYAETSETPEATAAAVESTVSQALTLNSVMTWVALLVCLAGLALLIRRADKRAVISLFLLTAAFRLAAWLAVSAQLPRTIATIANSGLFYITFPLLIFAAFFSNFAHLAELPKKYKLFLMMLPFLAAVFLFSYLPLYGWSYAFFNYKFGLPMDQQEFVGFKWFTELVTNAGQRSNIGRVMTNTFAMSGLNILTSWMPMVFAILLNEVTRTRFKKFVQIFTTLPNFISWALVFSFAMTMFSMDTGIYSKFMLSIGAINEPVAWLNSSEHIWLKMWGWSTWKGLGWGAIMYLAAISGIDQELYEAARVDGAGRWKQIRYITLPGLMPTFFVLLLLSISNIINNGMDQYLVFQNSMNKNTIEVLDLYVFNITIASTSSSMYSFGTAIGILKTLFSVTLLFTANFASKKLRGESIV